MKVTEGFRPRRIAYLGTPAVAVAPLRALVEAGVDVVLVVTAADKRRGRGGSLTPTPVKAAAVELGLEVSYDLDALADRGADLGVVVAYGHLLPPPTLALMPFVNLHFSLLPRWRGAAPVERAILAGDAETGVDLMELEQGMDTGAICAEARTPVGDKTLAELWDELSVTGAELLVDAVTRGFPAAVPQVGDVLHAPKLGPDDRHIAWTAPAEHVLRTIRLGDAWTTLEDRRVKVHAARAIDPTRETIALQPGELTDVVVGCGEGQVELIEVQPEGKGPMAAAAWRRGLHGLQSDDRVNFGLGPPPGGG